MKMNLPCYIAPKVYQSLPKQIKDSAIIYCRHYGQAGALKYYGKEYAPNTRETFRRQTMHQFCDAGIVLTASHNPPEYNGYKVYWNDGGQIVPPEDTEIIAEVETLDFSEIKFTANENLIQYLGSEIDEAFWQASVSNGTFPATKGKKDLKIVFTSLHGTSIKLMPEALRRAGYTDVHIVEEQRIPNGDFPTVASPNPEEPAALKMALELAEKSGADIVLGTDPDSDRMGVAVRNNKGNMQ